MTRNSNMTKKLLRALLLALAMVILYVSPAFAADASTWQEVRDLVNSGNDVTIRLTDDMRLNWQASTAEINNGKTVILDLNGHTITGDSEFGETYLRVKNGTLVITDSAEVKATSESGHRPSRHDQDETTVSDGTGIALPATFTNDSLTYYTTTSTVKNTIRTEETLTKHTVDLSKSGRLVGRSNHWNGLVVAEGSNATLRIEGGLFTNPNNQAVRVIEGAHAEIVGGYFCGNLNPYEGGTGGAVLVQKATLTVGSGNANDQVVFADNRAFSGGALAASDEGTTVTIRDGAVFSGNKATGSGHDGGGAILIGENAHATMEGGLVTHNWCTDNVVGANEGESSYDVCGGGIMVQGTLKMTGGQVTSNEAPGGGGISTRYWNGGVFLMTDGIVAGNVARLNEGGGITINMNGRGSIVGGHITNNRAEGKEHWGGGGIFSSNDSVLTMINTLIAYNEAGGFGGGLAGCSTARVDTHSVEIQNHSVAIYSNEAAGENTSGDNSTKNEDHLYAKNDPFFMRDGDYYQDYFSALNTTVCGGFLGEGNALWEGTIDSTEIKKGDIKPGEKVTSQSIAGLTSNPSSGDISKAIQAADVFVTGNYAYTHGGGILSNGYMIIGSHRFMEIGDRMTLKGDKTLSGGQLQDGQFNFVVTDEDDNELFTGTNNANSEIIFNGRLAFDKAGTYTFKVYEKEHNIEGVTKDPTVYTIVVTVRATETTVYAVDDDDITKTEAIKITFNKISSVKVYKSGVDDPVLDLSNIEKDDRSAYELPGDVLEFVNRISRDTGIVVSKTVVDASNSSANVAFGFTVVLEDRSINGTFDVKDPVTGETMGKAMTFVDGVATFTLKGGESAVAMGLPAGTKYTVTEEAVDGYYNNNPQHSGTVPAKGVSSEVFMNYAVGGLTVQKVVTSPSPSDAAKAFTFRITLTPGENRTGVYPAVKEERNGNQSTIGVNFNNGVAIVELKDGENIIISNLPAGLDYKVEEMNAEGFTVQTTGNTGEIDTDDTKVVRFINTRQKGELTLRKYVVGAPEGTDPEFEFTVELVDGADIDGYYGDMFFEKGVATVVLKHGQTATATELPAGLHYRITEKENDGYAVGIVGNSSGAISTTPTVVQFTNTAVTGLEISKTTTGSALDRDMAFEFEIVLEGPDGKPVSGTYSGVTFVDGKATISLKNGQSKVIDGLLDGTKATVMELKSEYSDHFIIQLNGVNVTNNPTGTFVLDSDDPAHARFSNLHRVGELEITKTTNSPIAEDLNRQFVFDVELSAPINGTFGNMVFTDGKATVYLANGQSAKAVNIPIGVTYTVTERAVSGFDSDPAGPQTGTMTEAGVKLAYTNTRRLGGFRLTKIVLAGEETEAKFGFKVILSSPYTGTFGDMTFVNGVAEFELADEQSIEAQDLPEGTVYQIVETTYDAAHFEPVVGTVVGNITANVTKTVNFTNRALDSLSVSKRVDGVVFEPDKEFTFTVELSDKTINGVKGDMEFVNGVATFTLKHGESATANGLPEGTTYTVTEENYDDYTTTSNGATGTISNNGASAASFVNTRKVGDLAVSKTLVSKRTADVNQEFTFTVTLSDTNINGAFGDMTFVDGVATVTLRGGQTKTAKGLPTGITYTVTEATADGFVLTSKTGDTGTITQTASTAAFTNTREVGDLTISKTVISDKAADADQEFTFTVTLDDRNISGTYGDMTFNRGIATVNLKGGASATVKGLPTGISYTVTEATAEGFALTSKTGDTGVISTTEAVAAFTNTRNTGDLEVSKTVVSDIAADKDQAFEFTVTLSDTTITGTYGEMEFDAGVANFTLTDGQKKTATGLPTGIIYTVEEKDVDGFTATSDGATGTISTTKSVAAFTNTRKVGDLEVTKTVVSDRAADKTRSFRFTVTLDDTIINGTYGGMTFKAGVAEFNLKDGETKTATGLPIGMAYTVTETDVEGYTITSDGAAGTISETKSVAAFTNTRKVGNLEVKKVVASARADDKTKEFTITVTLSDTTIAGSYGDMTFNGGVATLTLKADESAEATGLPTGITYEVIETTAEGFTVSYNGATGTISEQPAVATVTNTRDTSGLTVRKTVNSASAGDKAQAFAFTVTLSDTTITGTYGEMDFAAGVANFTLTDGQTKTATDLPTGITYTVTEEAVSGFTTSKTNDEGTIGAMMATAAFINTRDTGDLQVSKVVVSVSDNDKTKHFNFTVTLSDKSITGKFGDMIFTEGVATFTLTDGQKKTATGLPTGITYKVDETVADAYTTTYTGETGTISTTKSETIVTNTRQTGGLKVSKTVVGAPDANKNDTYEFTVTLTDASFIDGKFGEMEFVNGVATFELADGQTKTATGLPIGIHYTVTENETSDKYAVSIDGIGSGPITTGTSEVKFTNTYFSGLVISKQVIGAAQDHNTEFRFLITLKDADDKPVTGVIDGVTFDENGQAIITLKDGENLILDSLAIGTTATVTETDVDKTHFKVQINSVDKTEAPTFEHEMAAGESVHVHFTNVHREGSLEISKKTISPAESDRAREFVFTVTLKANATATEPLPISGKFGDMFFTNGVATVQIKNGQTVTATKLPAGVFYSVEEARVAGFGSGATNRTGTIVELTDKTGPNKVEFTNTREVGDLEVTKTVASAAAADKDQAFNFTVELSNKTINGTYGGMTFVDGVATFTMKHGETKTAAGLPTNITYTVTEESVDGFATTSTGATGTISTAKTTAVFTNTRATSGLAVTKTVVSKLAADKDVSFNFTVTLSDKSISGTYGDMTFTAGEATFTLKDGDSVIADGLPTGVDYKVEEETADGFVTTYTGATGTITDRVATVAVTNTRATSGLTVTKTVKGDVLDTQKKFTFTVTLSDTTITGVYGDMSFANGVAKFELAHSESKTAENLPIGVEYTVTEQADANYTTTYNGVTNATEATGTISDTAAVVEVTNTIKTGDLKVTKTVVGNAAEAGQKFSFRVVLNDALNGLYGDMTFENGEATFELANGENRTAVGLPVGVTYTITEAHSGYVVTVNGVTTDTATGTINIGENLVAYTNTKTQEVGGLKVEKTIIGLDADAQKAFTFTVTLDDATITGTYAVKDPATGVLATNGMDFLNGVATFTLKHGESKVADGLPVGTGYTVAETEDGSFTAAYTNEIGTIVKDTILEAKVTNTRKTSGLKVEKTVVSANAADLTKEFTFTVILSDKTITDTYADMTFTAGEATFTLKDGESKTATGLPTGITYTVKEEAAEGFSTTSVGAQGMISEQFAEAKFTNTADGDLIVRKTVTGTAGDKNLPFNFTVTLSDANINGTYGEMTFVAGVATFTLKDGETKTAVGLPANIGYTVTEENGEYTATKTGDVGTIPAGALAEAKFTNTLDTQPGGLTVTKTISGNAANMVDRFNFTVTLSDLTLTGTYGEMVFTNGVATFDLGHNESKSAAGLPAGIGYTVKEQPSTYAVYATGDTGIINVGTVSVAQFINTRNISLGGLTVTKTVTGEDGSKTQPFRFTVELLNANISGTYGEMLFVNGVANFTLTDGQTKTAMNLPAGTQYRVTEENSGYVVTKTGDVGYIPADGMATAAFINHLSIAHGDLRVSKFVTGDKADVTRKFNFRVTLTSPLTGTYGNMTFENGVATFALAHGESAFATRLPAGVQYVVEELDYEDYIVTATDDVGTIEADTTAQVTFINGRMPDTGDHSMISVYSTLMLLSAALLCICGFKAKKA